MLRKADQPGTRDSRDLYCALAVIVVICTAVALHYAYAYSSTGMLKIVLWAMAGLAVVSTICHLSALLRNARTHDWDAALEELLATTR